MLILWIVLGVAAVIFLLYLIFKTGLGMLMLEFLIAILESGGKGGRGGGGSSGSSSGGSYGGGGGFGGGGGGSSW